MVDFIGIDKVLDGIASAVQVPKALTDCTYDADVYRYSEAAAVLHQALHNTPEPSPQWVELSKTTGKPLNNDAVSCEGVAILKHMAGWYRRTVKERNDHVFTCLDAGLDPNTEPMTTSLNGGRYDWRKQPFQREGQIGFDRAKLVAFLDQKEIAHAHPNAPAAKVEAVTVTLPAQDESGLSKRERQIRSIESESDLLGYARLQIATGCKTILRNTCKKKYPSLFGAGNSPFDDAWKAAVHSSPPRLKMAEHSKFSGK